MSELILKYKITTKENLLCKKCRHSNQNTMDSEDELVFCRFDYEIKSKSHSCDVTVDDYYLFEEHDTTNCTWASNQDFEIMTENEE